MNNIVVTYKYNTIRYRHREFEIKITSNLRLEIVKRIRIWRMQDEP